MLSKVKEMMAASENLDEIAKKVKAVSKDVDAQSKELDSIKAEIAGLGGAVKSLSAEVGKLSSSVRVQMVDIGSAAEDLRKEVYDFKLIKADIKSKLVAELTEDFRKHISEEVRKLDTDVKGFNDLKDELSVLVTKFRSVEGEIDKFKAIAQEVKQADFQLSRHAKELASADQEKLRLMQKIDTMERLVAKVRRHQ